MWDDGRFGDRIQVVPSFLLCMKHIDKYSSKMCLRICWRCWCPCCRRPLIIDHQYAEHWVITVSYNWNTAQSYSIYRKMRPLKAFLIFTAFNNPQHLVCPQLLKFPFPFLWEPFTPIQCFKLLVYTFQSFGAKKVLRWSCLH